MDAMKRVQLAVVLMVIGAAAIFAMFYAQTGTLGGRWSHMSGGEHRIVQIAGALIAWGIGAMINFAVQRTRLRKSSA